MSEKKITYANVMVNEVDRGKLTQLKLTISPPRHIITGQPDPPAITQSLNLNAKTNYGADNEDIIIQLFQPHPPELNSGSVATQNDLGVAYQMTGRYCQLSEAEHIRYVRWTARNLPYELTLDPNTGYVHGQLTKGGVYTIYITCTTEWGSDTATLTITVTEFKYWSTGAAPDCPATPGYKGTHNHAVTVQLPDGVQHVISTTNRSTVTYGGRSITLSASCASSYNYSYTYTSSDGTQSSQKAPCYRKVRVNGEITGGYAKSDTRSVLYANCHFKGRVKFATIITDARIGPNYWYVDIDYTYDFFEVPGFSYDINGVIQTYSG